MIATLLFNTIISTCPNITGMLNFNTTEYLRSTWYIQEQQINGYQNNNTLYCVAQTLELSNTTVPFFDGNVISVYNYANIGKVNGEQQNQNNFTLCARQNDPHHLSELLNGPCFLPNLFAGPYWVLAAGPYTYNYQWAIVSGGPPTYNATDGNCTNKLSGINGSGLWLFTRDRFGETAYSYVSQMRNILINLGYSISLLLNVEQNGCNYTNAYIK